MSNELILICFIVSFVIFIVIIANIEYRKDLTHKKEKSEEEKDQEWLDNQW